MFIIGLLANQWVSMIFSNEVINYAICYCRSRCKYIPVSSTAASLLLTDLQQHVASSTHLFVTLSLYRNKLCVPGISLLVSSRTNVRDLKAPRYHKIPRRIADFTQQHPKSRATTTTGNQHRRPITTTQRSENKYDKRAVEVYWNNNMPGYIPKIANMSISQILDNIGRLKTKNNPVIPATETVVLC